MTQIRIFCFGHSKLELGAYLEFGICDLGFYQRTPVPPVSELQLRDASSPSITHSKVNVGKCLKGESRSKNLTSPLFGYINLAITQEVGRGVSESHPTQHWNL